MPYASFLALYPRGTVYYYTNKNFFDRLIYKMLDKAIYSKGGQYDKTSEALSFIDFYYKETQLLSVGVFIRWK